ncbi:hypothetical protein PQI07_36675 [Methylobacterium sp. 092160098-2]|uniref:hypothetical protein n=1 Tax=Methylobacterium sp. 092160098-2 TaxID=3025129 RepID=UPI002381CE35|nr:hypothetical protein [Methylobacterium sp. 092160098-2]MDE4916104.1 hypothetical protein [Methylobacterium sp. 092160098-2]
MTNAQGPLIGPDLPACFAASVDALLGTLQAAAGPGGSGAPRQARPKPTCSGFAPGRRDTPGLYDAGDAVRFAVRAVEDITRRPEERVPNRTALLAAARADALEAVGYLAALLRTAEPDPKARGFGRR